MQDAKWRRLALGNREVEAVEVGESSEVDGVVRVMDEQWRAVVAVAEELGKKVADLSQRMAAVERQLTSDVGPGSARPRSSVG